MFSKPEGKTKGEQTMEESRESRKRQDEYLTAMSLMKGMKAKGIIDKEDLLKVEKALADQFKPIWRYQEFEL